MQNEGNNSPPQPNYANVVHNAVVKRPNQHTILLDPITDKTEQLTNEVASAEEENASCSSRKEN